MNTGDLLQDAVVDITMLVSTVQALRHAHAEAASPHDARRHERQAAWRAVGKGLADAQRLASVEHACRLEPALIRQGVWRPLRDLMSDWQATPPPA